MQQAVPRGVNDERIDPMTVMMQISPKCCTILVGADAPNRVPVVNNVVDLQILKNGSRGGAKLKFDAARKKRWGEKANYSSSVWTRYS